LAVVRYLVSVYHGLCGVLNVIVGLLNGLVEMPLFSMVMLEMLGWWVY